MPDAKLLNELRITHGQRGKDGRGYERQLVRVAIIAAVALAVCVVWWWRPPTAIAVQTVTAATPHTNAPLPLLQATGYVSARRQATVSAQITGTLVQVLIEEGDKVTAGQVIARLDDAALRAELNTALVSAEAAAAQVGQLQAQLAQAVADARRASELSGIGILSKQSEEQSLTSVATLKAQLEASLKTAEVARSQITRAKVNLDFTVVRAPFAGVVSEKAAEVGEIVSPLSASGGFTRSGIGTIVDMDSLGIDVDVNEAYIGQVKVSMPVEAVLGAYPDWRIPAHVIAIVPTADKGKATVKVRIALEQKDPRIAPNMGARVSFLNPKPNADNEAVPPKGVLLPPTAVVKRGERSVVYVVLEGKAQLRAVTAAPNLIGSHILISQGLSAGDTVVNSPPEALRDGATVAVQP
jgi:RND family efflux transporter MFP subunit